MFTKKVLFFFVLSLLTFYSCERKTTPQRGTAEKDTPSIVSGHTAEHISREAEITVAFVEDMVFDADVGKKLDVSPFSIKPKIIGYARWINKRTLEFNPLNRLPDGKTFKVTVDLKKIMQEPPEKSTYTFVVTSMKQSFSLDIEGLEVADSDNPQWQQIRGAIALADVEDGELVKKMVAAQYNGKALPITWSQDPDRKNYHFVIQDIKRDDDAGLVTILWDGKSIGVDKKGERTIEVPSINTFSVSSVRSVQGDQQYIEIRFSDPVLRNQTLKGLITATPSGNLQFTTSGSIVRVYNNVAWSGNIRVHVRPGIKNTFKRRLKESSESTVAFNTTKPRVDFIGKGVIIPTTRGATVPFKAINLRGVIVEALQVFDDNMVQFLQVNEYKGMKQLKRVGRVIWRKEVPLDITGDSFNRWNTFALDLSSLIEKYPGGMYRLRLYFNRRQAVYTCSDEDSVELPDSDPMAFENINDGEDKENSSWDYAQNYYYGRGDDWNHRNDPCHDAFYKPLGDHNISVARNVLISDIGLIAKKGSADTLVVAVTDLKTSNPLPQVALSVFDYQQQQIGSAKSSAAGIAKIYCPRTPFVLSAQNGEQRGFLKLGNGDALSVSQFDVAGDKVQQGLKGHLYGERGVWRPGDSLFLTFVLQDLEKRLPPDHPVTFTLRDPRGRKVQSLTKVSSVNGFYNFSTKTDDDAPTGNWTASVKVGGVTFSTPLKIETVMPNRLKITLDFGDSITALSAGAIEGTLHSEWLHGAKAQNLDAEIGLSLVPRRTSFTRYGDYIFDDPVREFTSENQEVFRGTLDADGNAEFTKRLTVNRSAKGLLSAQFNTKVFEPGGAFSTDRFSVPFHPYTQYVGLQLPKGDKARGMLLTDTTHKARLALLDKDGESVASGKVEVTMYKIKWRWWWEKGAESLAKYNGKSSYSPIKKDTVTIANGQAAWPFEINYPAWGRYLIRARDLTSDHATGAIVYIDWPGWAGRAQKDNPGGATMLTFSAEKNTYEVGEDITLTIPSTKTGRGLVSIENGSRVIQTDWVTPGEETIRYTFRAEKFMSPNIYVHVTFIQPHLQDKNDVPMRVYGVIPLKIVDPETVIHPQLQVPPELEPETKAEIIVSEQQGKTFTYTLAIVDEGLLGLTRFHTPDLWSHFYRREALGVKTWDIFDHVAGAYSGRLERLLAVGGGDAAGKKGGKKANRFPPMVRFYGPFELKKNQKAKHVVDIPQYIGAVRVMVVAGQNGAYGKTDKSLFVRKPLMVLGTLPRVISVQDSLAFTATVFSLNEAISDVTLSVNTDGPVSLIGASAKKVTFKQLGDKNIPFWLKVHDTTGIASITVSAKAASFKAAQTIECAVRNPQPYITTVFDTAIGPGTNWQGIITLPGLAGTNVSLLEVSQIAPLNLGRRLNYLIRYPHGCVEQTTSAVFPQVYLPRLVKLSPEKEAQVTAHIQQGIERLQGFQNMDGGFGYWPGASTANLWGTNYAGYFLTVAKNAGYAVPDNMYDLWVSFQEDKARRWTAGGDRSELVQANRLFTLALANKPQLSAMNRLKESSDLPAIAAWQLAGAYVLAGQKQAAGDLMGKYALRFKDYREQSQTYGSTVRDKAIALHVLCLMDDSRRAEKLADEISQALSDETWMSTQSTAYALLAMAEYSGLVSGSQKMAFSFAVTPEKEKKYGTTSPLFSKDIDCGVETSYGARFTNKGDKKLYVRFISEGQPELGKEQPGQEGMTIKASYYDMDNNWLDPARITQGTDFIARVEISNTGVSGEYEEVALSQIFPAGWEIHPMRLDKSNRGYQSSFTYRDIRDDRVYTYFDIDHGEKKTFSVMLNAAYAGTYYLPLIRCAPMYDESVYAQTAGEWVNVVAPGNE